MSESTTPRTDAQEVFRPNHEGQGVGWVKSKFARTLETELQQAKREVESLGNDLFEKQSVITELAGRAFTTKQEYDLLRREVEELKAKLYKATGQQARDSEETRAWLASENHGR